MGDDRKNPPNPYPEPKPKEPSELGEKVDWMTYTHQELYDMVHTGVDLTSAASVKDNWTTLGSTLAEVKDQLIGAIFASSSGWEGVSAEKARDGLLTVVKWAENTSDHAKNVAECITLEIEHVQTAREQMPKPTPAPTPVPPVAPAPTAAVAPLPPPVRMISPANRFSADAFEPAIASAYEPAIASRVPIGSLTNQTPFTGIDQVGAPVVDATMASDANHRAAANVMAAFQQGSFAVDQTVPAFTPPVNPVAPQATSGLTGHERSATPPAVGSAPVVLGSVAPPVTGTSRPSASGGGGYVPSSTRTGFTGTFQAPQTGGGGGGGAVPVPTGPGGAAGLIGNSAESRTAATPASAMPKASGMPAAGGMMAPAPMAAGAPVAARDDERDYERAKYLEEDDNLFGLDKKAAPPVIGT
jgi:hypothetical protein